MGELSIALADVTVVRVWSAADMGSDDGDGEHRVRVVILTGPDFKTPALVCGGMLPDRESAEAVAAKAREALASSPPQVRDGKVVWEPPEPLAPIGESGEYPRPGV